MVISSTTYFASEFKPFVDMWSFKQGLSALQTTLTKSENRCKTKIRKK